MVTSSAEIRGRPGALQAGFTLLELVVAMVLFAFIIIEVLADRETSLQISADARNTQIVRYLAAYKIDEIRHDPDTFGESDSGDFEELQTDWQDFTAFSWEMEVTKVVAVGSSEDAGADYLFEEDSEEAPSTTADGEALDPQYVRKLRLTVRFEPDGVPRPDLSLTVITYLPPEPEEEEGTR
jgi:prepilin-type N-terminal cleavage/methylation domain-containing protein